MINYGIRYEITNPNTETRNRLNAFIPGVQSHVMPNAPTRTGDNRHEIPTAAEPLLDPEGRQWSRLSLAG